MLLLRLQRIPLSEYEFTGKINKGAYHVILDSKDPNASLLLTASGVYDEKNPTVKVNGEVIKLDVNKLGFYEKPMILAGKIDGDFTSLDPNNLNGYLNLKRLCLFRYQRSLSCTGSESESLFYCRFYSDYF
jgi:hypothetical protein